MSDVDGRGGQNGRKTPAIDQETRAAIDVITYLGNLYARLQADAHTQTLGAYTAGQAVRERIVELNDPVTGELAEIELLTKTIDDFVEQARNLTKEDLSPKGVRQESSADDSHVSEPPDIPVTYADYPLAAPEEE